MVTWVIKRVLQGQLVMCLILFIIPYLIAFETLDCFSFSCRWFLDKVIRIPHHLFFPRPKITNQNLYFPQAKTKIPTMSIITSLALLSLLNPLISATPVSNNTNTPENPVFMKSANLTLYAWTSSKCENNTNSHDGVKFDDVLYNKNEHGLAVSFSLNRDLEANEQLDLSFFQDAQGNSHDGVDKECALFQYTASPDSTGATLKGNQCYEPSVPVTCMNLWKTS